MIIAGCRTHRRSCSSPARAWRSWPSPGRRSSTSSRAASTRAAPRARVDARRRDRHVRVCAGRRRRPDRADRRLGHRLHRRQVRRCRLPALPRRAQAARARGAAGGRGQRSLAALPGACSSSSSTPKIAIFFVAFLPQFVQSSRADRPADPRPGHHLHPARRAQRWRLRPAAPAPSARWIARSARRGRLAGEAERRSVYSAWEAHRRGRSSAAEGPHSRHVQTTWLTAIDAAAQAPSPRSTARSNLRGSRHTARAVRPPASRLRGRVARRAPLRPRLPTPVNLFRDGDRYVVALTYGADSQWGAQRARRRDAVDIETRGRRVHLAAPEVVRDAERSLVPSPIRPVLAS